VYYSVAALVKFRLRFVFVSFLDFLNFSFRFRFVFFKRNDRFGFVNDRFRFVNDRFRFVNDLFRFVFVLNQYIIIRDVKKLKKICNSNHVFHLYLLKCLDKLSVFNKRAPNFLLPLSERKHFKIVHNAINTKTLFLTVYKKIVL